MKPGDWIGYDLATTDARARELTAVKFGVSEMRIEVKRTGGGVLARASVFPPCHGTAQPSLATRS